MVEPKRKKLAEAEAQLEAANTQLKEKQDALAAVIKRVNTLKQQLADAESEQRQLNAQVGWLLGLPRLLLCDAVPAVVRCLLLWC